MIWMKFKKIRALLLVFVVILLLTGCSSNSILHTHKVGFKDKPVDTNLIKKRSNNINKILTVGLMVYVVSVIPNGLEIVNTIGGLVLKNKEIESKK